MTRSSGSGTVPFKVRRRKGRKMPIGKIWGEARSKHMAQVRTLQKRTGRGGGNRKEKKDSIKDLKRKRKTQTKAVERGGDAG